MDIEWETEIMISLIEKLRTGHVHRWHIVRTAREQTLAEHMYRVYLITDEICRILNLHEDVWGICIIWALNHDVPEVLVGDMPTPTKKFLKGAFNHIENSLDKLHKAMYEDLKENNPVVLDIVKLADLMESIDFLTLEAIGDHASNVKKSLSSDFFSEVSKCREKYPDHDWNKIVTLLSTILPIGS